MKRDVQGQTELRVKVAELCDLTNLMWFSGELHHDPGGMNAAVVHDYPNDLDACAELRQRIKGRERFAYLEHLTRIVGFDKNITFGTDDFGQFCWAITNATATDHCLAFVATMEGSPVPTGTDEHLAPPGSQNPKPRVR